MTFKSCDFPAFGAPTMATSKRFFSAAAAVLVVVVSIGASVAAVAEASDDKYRHVIARQLRNDPPTLVAAALVAMVILRKRRHDRTPKDESQFSVVKTGACGVWCVAIAAAVCLSWFVSRSSVMRHASWRRVCDLFCRNYEHGKNRMHVQFVFVKSDLLDYHY